MQPEKKALEINLLPPDQLRQSECRLHFRFEDFHHYCNVFVRTLNGQIYGLVEFKFHNTHLGRCMHTLGSRCTVEAFFYFTRLRVRAAKI